MQLGASPTAGASGGFGGPSGAGAVTMEIEGEKAEVPTRLEAATEKAYVVFGLRCPTSQPEVALAAGQVAVV